ncbi:hypothetical protein B0T17DRAFT_521706 [Bombardia bombarda]|uniref:Uncharacterized protein n=1 Tax=Bombardia bombarda TaxID=252184 RepID=A0AA39XNT9_9PEZI|nr:hypothetical protein B0T17DRAFT_521706 [Bombardia bombarda]
MPMPMPVPMRDVLLAVSSACLVSPCRPLSLCRVFLSVSLWAVVLLPIRDDFDDALRPIVNRECGVAEVRLWAVAGVPVAETDGKSHKPIRGSGAASMSIQWGRAHALIPLGSPERAMANLERQLGGHLGSAWGLGKEHSRKGRGPTDCQ